MSKTKLFCYVDETGTDDRSIFFLMATIVIEQHREDVISALEGIERISGKNRTKWRDAGHEQRQRYIEAVLSHELLSGRIVFSRYPKNRNTFHADTIDAIARAVMHFASSSEHYSAAIHIDALGSQAAKHYGAELRKVGIRTADVKGIRDEGSNVMMRLADAMCGFTRAGLEGKTPFKDMLKRGIANGSLQEI